LSKLIERAEQGEEITIARAGKPVVRLGACHETALPQKGGRPDPGEVAMASYPRIRSPFVFRLWSRLEPVLQEIAANIGKA
jgi:prevent-host-death family protein